MRQLTLRATAALVAATCSFGLAYNPQCPAANVDWMSYLPVVGPVRSMQLRWNSPPEGFLDLTPGQRRALEPVGEVSFDEDQNILTQWEPGLGTSTYAYENGLRVGGRIVSPEGDESEVSYTYRSFTEDGRVIEFAMDVLGPEQFRRVYGFRTRGDYWLIQHTDYNVDGSSSRNGGTIYQGCAAIDRDLVVDGMKYYTLFDYYLNDQRGNPSETGFDTLSFSQKVIPVDSMVPLSPQDEEEFSVEVYERDARGNPTVFVLARRVPRFDEVVTKDPILRYVTYEYY